jgi:hypothetical protein
MYAVQCWDKQGALQIRLDNRAAHLDFLGAHPEAVTLAGPLLSEDHQTPIGSLLVLNFDDRAQLDAFLAQDPYAKAGLFERVEAVPYRKVLPK